MNVGDRVGWEDVSGTRYGKIASDLTHDRKYNVIVDDGDWLVIPKDKLYAFKDYNIIVTDHNGNEVVYRFEKATMDESEARRTAINLKYLWDAKSALLKDGPKWVHMF
jgi:hypothetical protein